MNDKIGDKIDDKIDDKIYCENDKIYCMMNDLDLLKMNDKIDEYD